MQFLFRNRRINYTKLKISDTDDHYDWVTMQELEAGKSLSSRWCLLVPELLDTDGLQERRWNREHCNWYTTRQTMGDSVWCSSNPDWRKESSFGLPCHPYPNICDRPAWNGERCSGVWVGQKWKGETEGKVKDKVFGKDLSGNTGIDLESEKN